MSDETLELATRIEELERKLEELEETVQNLVGEIQYMQRPKEVDDSGMNPVK